MQYSPKLKRVIAEIKAIIETNDIAGFVCLVEPGNSEYLHVINPSFSVARFDGSQIRIQTKNIKGSPNEKRLMLEKTSNMFALLSTTVAKNGLSLLEVSKYVDSQVGAKHTGSSHTSQNELDN